MVDKNFELNRLNRERKSAGITARVRWNSRKNQATIQAYVQRTHPTTGVRKILLGEVVTQIEDAVADYERLKQEWLTELSLINVSYKPTMQFSKFIEMYVSQNRTTNQGKSKRTEEDWLYTVQIVSEEMAKIQLNRLSFNDLRDFFKKISTGRETGRDSSAMRRMTHIAAALRFAFEEGLLKKQIVPYDYRERLMGSRVAMRNQQSRQAVQKKDKMTTNLQFENLQNVLENLKVRIEDFQQITQLIGIIPLLTGMRIEEAQALTPRSIIQNDDGAIRFYISDSYDNRHHEMNGGTKTGVFHETAFLNPELSAVFLDYVELREMFLREQRLEHLIEGPILLNLVGKKYLKLGRPVTQESIAKRLKVVLNEPTVNLYSIRHYIATTLVNNVQGGNYADVAYLLGNSVETLMRRYVHPNKMNANQLAMSLYQTAS